MSVTFEFTMGSIFFDPEFPFPDGGEPAPKLLILLNEPTNTGEPYILVWANTQDVEPKIRLGCYPETQFFFIPADADFFEEDTWIYLYDCFPAFDLEYTIENYKSSLKNETLGQLVKCIEATEAVAGEYIQLVKNSWKRRCRTK